MPNGLSKDLPCGPFRQFVPWGAWCSWQLQQRFLVYVNIFVFQMVVRTVQISYGLDLPYLTLYKTWITLGPCSMWCWSDSHRIFPWRMTWWLVGICDWKATRGFEVLFKPVGLVKFLGSPKSVWWLLRLSRKNSWEPWPVYNMALLWFWLGLIALPLLLQRTAPLQ